MELLAAGFIEDNIVPKFNYWIYVILMMIGLYAMIAKNNLIKKLIGMAVFQTAIILFYVSVAVKSEEASIPILPHHGHDYSPKAAAAHAVDGVHEDQTHEKHGGDTLEGYEHHHAEAHHPKVPKPDNYANPLPHVLMLTAIVVGVATLGLALAITQKIYREYGTLEENELLEKVRAEDDG